MVMIQVLKNQTDPHPTWRIWYLIRKIKQLLVLLDYKLFSYFPREQQGIRSSCKYWIYVLDRMRVTFLIGNLFPIIYEDCWKLIGLVFQIWDANIRILIKLLGQLSCRTLIDLKKNDIIIIKWVESKYQLPRFC